MAKVLSKAEWKRRKKLIKYAKLGVILALAIVIVLVLLLGVLKIVRNIFSGDSGSETSAGTTMKQELNITEYFLTPNDYSRPQLELTEVKGIVIHYVSNAGSTATGNRNYFESLKDGESGVSASSHFIVGLEGEIVQCIPLNEIAYASKERNVDTISIEFCHPQIDGKPNAETYDALVRLTAYLCKEYSLKTEAVLRHYDVTGKNCPKYYVEDAAAWTQFLADVAAAMEKK
ncbi:MAG: N-acetylmuramoyl-L-alanine amidase [Lachnospiraceae bacterium]|nr:N-acetylmuramoyl-L-alanine amidase [Lachnospiraceae bacterium]